MAGFTRTIHPASNMEWQKLKLLCPDLHVEPTATENGKKPEEPMGLAFIDADGESHIYVFTEEGRINLIRKLTGGLVVPST